MFHEKVIRYLNDALRTSREMVEAQWQIIAERDALIKDLADELEAEIEERYKRTKSYPLQRSRYERDMQNVLRARELERRPTEPPPPQDERGTSIV
jgi:hypothetical protein